MEVKKYNSDDERTILIGMVVDRNVLAKLVPRWTEAKFQSPWAQRVAEWCVIYYEQYHKAPGSNVQSIYNTWSADTRNKDTSEIIGQFLDSLSRQYRRLKRESNSDYIIDIAARHFNRVKLERLSEAIESDISQGKIDKALGRTVDFHKLEIGTGAGIEVFTDKESIQAAFNEQHEPLITYTGGLGKFFSNRLERDGFIAFQGPEKRGKSFWLQEIAFRAITQRRRVAFFECGDLSQHQIMRRFMVRVSKHPQYPCMVKYPTSIRKLANGKIDITYKRQRYKKSLTWRKAYKHCRKLTKKRGIKSMLRLSCHLNDSLSVDGIRGILDEWARKDWIPEVVIIDYADILNMDHHGLEGRDRIDHIWKQLRRLSQERHCLVVTATQASAAAYDIQTQGKQHFSNDKRKNAHVTGMVGLNQTPIEKEKGYMRLNWIELREGWYSERKCCYVATCFELANMAIRSIF